MADFLESYVSMKTHVQIRFGRWRDIIAEPLPEDQDLYLLHNSLVALRQVGGPCGALGEVAEAESERVSFHGSVGEGCPTADICTTIAALICWRWLEQMLDGELEYRKENYDHSICPSAQGDRAGGCAALRRALGLDSAGSTRPGRADSGTGPDRGGRAAPIAKTWAWPDRSSARLYSPGQYLEPQGSGRVSAPPVGSERAAEARILIRQRLELAAARSDLPVGASCHCAQAAMQLVAAE